MAGSSTFQSLIELAKRWRAGRPDRDAREFGPEPVRELLTRLRPSVTDKKLVRVGAEGDGGYLAPDDFEGIAACFSPGVGRLARFEMEMAARGVPCFLADASVDHPPVQNPLFNFQRKYIGSEDSETFMTLEKWISSAGLPDSTDLLLQMDIEGSEFPVLLEASDATLKRFRIIIIEFHHLRLLFNPDVFPLFKFIFSKLLREFVVVHLHPNNYAAPTVQWGLVVPRAMEFTLLRKDRVGECRPARSFPHPLDRRNVKKNEDVPLPECWYRESSSGEET